MPINKREEPEILAGAELEPDCQTKEPDLEQPPTIPLEMLSLSDDEEDEESEHEVTWDQVRGEALGRANPLVDWRQPPSGWARVLERISLAVERPFNRLAGTTQLNPFYHTGVITTFLLIIVGLTGAYLFFFFQYGFDASYQAVNRMEGQFIARTMRAIHRYASGAAVITTLLHAYRTLFMERFRGPRWLAWITGIVMAVLLWLAGVTGYWLIWDERAQLITEGFTRFLQTVTGWGPSFVAAVGRADRGESWPLMLLMFGVHVLLFLVVAGFFWLHIRRLRRPRWLPELHWVTGIGVVMLLGAIIFPAGMLLPANLARLPGRVTLDPIFLFYLPVGGTNLAVWLWGGLVLATAVAAALPWVTRGKRPSPPKVNIIKERCTGCTKCALDCPYGAIEMVERHDGKPHKFIAIEDPGLCVSCGICVGSCDGVAVSLGDTPPELLWETVAMRLAMARATTPAAEMKVVFTCERHAAHGARPYLEDEAGPATVIPLPCAGTIPPDILPRTLAAGVAEVQVVGCPPDDCVNREGNLWAEQRLTRQRVPRLKRAYANAPVTARWLPPDDFVQSLHPAEIPVVTTENGASTPDYLSSRVMKRPLTWRQLVLGFALLVVVLGIQVLLTDLPFQAYAAEQARLQLVVADPAMPYGRRLDTMLPETDVVTLALEMDGELLWSQRYTTADLQSEAVAPLVARLDVLPGVHHLRVQVDGGGKAVALFDEQVTLAPREIFWLGTTRYLRQRPSATALSTLQKPG